MKINGRKIAEDILQNLQEKVEKLKKGGITPTLAIILVGNDPASLAYVKQKEKKAQSIGAKTITYNLESKIQNSELINLIKKLNDNNNIHGIIVQQPLPRFINVANIVRAINPGKDVDGFLPNSNFQMPLTAAVSEILKIISVPIPFLEWLKAKNIVVIGKGETGGKPIINTLQKLGVQPLIIDSKTKNPKLITKSADILISAVGKPNIIKARNIKRGVILMGIGLRRGDDGKLHGDYEEDEIKNIASFYTPTPGGVGPLNVAMLLGNLVLAAEDTHLPQH